MGILNAKTFLTGIAVVLFGWFFQQSLIPTLLPHLVGTPAAGFYSVLAGLIFWALLFVLFWRHDRTVRSEAK